MKIPKTIKKDNVIYKFIKMYPNFLLYESDKGIRECFGRWELGLLPKRKKKVIRDNVRIENVRY